MPQNVIRCRIVKMSTQRATICLKQTNKQTYKQAHKHANKKTKTEEQTNWPPTIHTSKTLHETAQHFEGGTSHLHGKWQNAAAAPQVTERILDGSVGKRLTTTHHNVKLSCKPLQITAAAGAVVLYEQLVTIHKRSRAESTHEKDIQRNKRDWILWCFLPPPPGACARPRCSCWPPRCTTAPRG